MKRIRIDLGTKRVPSFTLENEVKRETTDYLIDLLKNEFYKFQGESNDDNK